MFPLSGRLIRLSEVQPVEVEWLWKPYVPLGKLTIIEGDPGVGKSFLTLAIASAGSRGNALPGDNHGEPFTSLILTAEDGLADTLRPRVDRMGADPSKIVVLDELVMLDEPGLARIDEATIETGAKLVVIDPLVAYIGSGTDIHRANETRAQLAPLANLAERQNVAICVVRHLAKGRTKAIYAGLGSIDFIAAVRSALLVGFDPSDEKTRVMAHTKANLAPRGASQAFTVDTTGTFMWAGESELTAQDLLSLPSVPTARDDASEFLLDLLTDGPVRATEVYRLATERGISGRTLQRAKKSVGVRSQRVGIGAGSYSEWHLP